MLKIGVFDDNIMHLNHIYELLVTKFNERNIDYSINKFNDITYLEKAIKDRTLKYDVLFWDIQINQGDTLQLANEIYSLYPDIQMVYVTSYDYYIHDIFNSNALYYVDKKDLDKKIDQVIDKIMNLYTHQKLMIKNKDSIYMVDMKKIIFIERKLRVTYIKCTDNISYKTRDKLSELTGKLNQRFIRTHNSFIVNIDYIEKLTRTSAYLINGVIVPISRQYHKIIKDNLL